VVVDHRAPAGRRAHPPGAPPSCPWCLVPPPPAAAPVCHTRGYNGFEARAMPSSRPRSQAPGLPARRPVALAAVGNVQGADGI